MSRDPMLTRPSSSTPRPTTWTDRDDPPIRVPIDTSGVDRLRRMATEDILPREAAEIRRQDRYQALEDCDG